MEERVLRCETIDPEGFAPFGQVISVYSREADASNDELQFWNRLSEMSYEGKTSISIVETYGKNGLDEFNLEQHTESEETLIPTDDIYIVVALSDPADPKKPDIEAARAFKVPRQSAVTLGKGVWHHAPLTKEEVTRTFVVFQSTTPEEDFFMVDLADDYDCYLSVEG